MKRLRRILRRNLVPSLLVGGFVAITIFYFVNQPKFSGNFLNGVMVMDWGDIDLDQYRSVRTDLSRRVWSLRFYRQKPPGALPPPITLKRKTLWESRFAAIRKVDSSTMPLWEIKAPSMIGITAIVGIPLAYFLSQSATCWRRVRGKQCLSCGYSTTGWFGDLCPECGIKHHPSRKHFGIRTLFSALMLAFLFGGSVWQVFGLGAGNAGTNVTGQASNQISFRQLGQPLPAPVPIPVGTYEACKDLGLSKAELEWIVNGDLDSSVHLFDRMGKYFDVTYISPSDATDPCVSWILGWGQAPTSVAPVQNDSLPVPVSEW